MIDISLFGTFLLWPIVLLAHFTRLESIDYQHIRWLLTSIALTSALSKTLDERTERNILLPLIDLVFNLLTIVIPFRYMSLASVASLLLVIPLTSGKCSSLCFDHRWNVRFVVIDHYVWQVTYSSLVISAILCSFAGVLLSMIPKQWFQAGETGKMKQALGLLNKDSAGNPSATAANTTTMTTGTSSAFEEIRAQRRIRNALLYNDVKTWSLLFFDFLRIKYSCNAFLEHSRLLPIVPSTLSLTCLATVENDLVFAKESVLGIDFLPIENAVLTCCQSLRRNCTYSDYSILLQKKRHS